MRCSKCGAELEDNDMFCKNCGAPTQGNGVNSNSGDMYSYNRQASQANDYSQGNRVASGGGKNSSDVVKICICTIIGIVILVLVMFIGHKVFSMIDTKNEANGGSKTNIGSNETEQNITIGSNNKKEDDDKDKDDEITIPVPNKQDTYKVNFGGFNLYIPDTLIYQIDYTNNMLIVGDSLQTWVAQIGIVSSMSYQKLKQNKNSISTNIAQGAAEYNPTISNAVVETINGTEYILLEASIAGENGLIGYAELNSMNILYFQLFNEDNDYNREYIKEISKIISTAEYVGTSSYLKAGGKVGMPNIRSTISELAK